MDTDELSSNRIVGAILAGIVEARHTYAAWTGNNGYFAWAPEYLMTVSVAQAVWDWCTPLTVWPEFRLGDAVRDSGAPPCGQPVPGRLDGNRRADLLIYRGGSRPHAVVEIKRNVGGWSRIAADVDRMRSLVSASGSSFELGVVAFNCTYMAHAGERERAVLQDRLLRMADTADDVCQPGWRCRLSCGGINHDGHEYWSVAAVVMERSDSDPALLAENTRYSTCESASRQVPSPP
jgi:hypothetical protein